jgi:hypothetical protein
MISNSVLSASSSESVRSSKLPATTGPHKESATNVPNHSSPKALPIAAIAGAAVGGLVLLVLGVLLLLYVRCRKYKNIYQAPIYISPFNASCDMAQESRISPRKDHDHIEQLDSRDTRLLAEGGTASLRYFAELPAEPIARRL